MPEMDRDGTRKTKPVSETQGHTIVSNRAEI